MSENNFPRAGFFTRGYETSQVDEFFADARKAYEGGVPAEKFSAAQVRGAHFDLVRRGYQTAAIDQAMDRLEAAFVRRDRADNVAVNGSQAWMERVAQRGCSVRGANVSLTQTVKAMTPPRWMNYSTGSHSILTRIRESPPPRFAVPLLRLQRMKRLIKRA